jgi:choice-of-anchor A domain-containing protein
MLVGGTTYANISNTTIGTGDLNISAGNFAVITLSDVTLNSGSLNVSAGDYAAISLFSVEVLATGESFNVGVGNYATDIAIYYCNTPTMNISTGDANLFGTNITVAGCSILDGEGFAMSTGNGDFNLTLSDIQIMTMDPDMYQGISILMGDGNILLYMAYGNIQSNASKFKSLFAIGDISMRSTNVYGQVSVGGSFMQSASRFGETHQINPADFDFQQITESLIATSRNISTNLTNETATVFSGGTWNLYGNDPLFNYFEIDIPAINPTFSIHVPEGATTILNFGASHYDFFQTTIQVAQPTGFGADSSQLLINFPAASSLNFQFSQIQGTILAPIAQANIFGSILGGQIIASDISIFGSNLKGQSFQGYFEKPADLPNQPAIVVLLEGLAILRVFRWIRIRPKLRNVNKR